MTDEQKKAGGFVEYVREGTAVDLAEDFAIVKYDAANAMLGGAGDDLVRRYGKWELCHEDYRLLSGARQEKDGSLMFPEFQAVPMLFLGLPLAWVAALRVRSSQLVIGPNELSQTRIFPGPELTRIDHGPNGPERM